MASVGYTCYQMGQRTCETEGNVEYIRDSINWYGECTTGDWVYSDPVAQSGDSGGPVYVKSSGDAYLLNIHSYGDGCGRNSEAVAGYKLENDYNIYV